MKENLLLLFLVLLLGRWSINVAWWHVLDSKLLKTRGEIFLGSASLLSVALHRVSSQWMFVTLSLSGLSYIWKIDGQQFSKLQCKKYSFIYLFWLCWISIAAGEAISSCSERRLLSSCGARASHCGGFSCCEAQTPGAWAQKLRLTGLVALQQVVSFRTRDQTHVPCTGR